MTTCSQHGPDSTTATPPPTRYPLVSALGPLIVDVGLPLALTQLALHGLGMGLVSALALGGAVPLVRSINSVIIGHRVNSLAALMLITTVVGLVLGALAGDARLMFARDAAISAVIAASLLASTIRGTPALAPALIPFVTRGHADRIEAWHRLTATSPRFLLLQRRYTTTWGVLLLVDCAARAVLAFIVPLPWLAWLGSAIVSTTILAGILISGPAGAEEMITTVAASVGEEEARATSRWAASTKAPPRPHGESR